MLLYPADIFLQNGLKVLSNRVQLIIGKQTVVTHSLLENLLGFTNSRLQLKDAD